MDLKDLLIKILFGIGGFMGGIIITIVKGWSDRIFRKIDNINRFKDKVVDVIAVVTPSGYSLRQNEVDRRKMQRSAFHLEKLGKKELANDILSYIRYWNEVYQIKNSKAFQPKEETKRVISIIHKLDVLTTSIING